MKLHLIFLIKIIDFKNKKKKKYGIQRNKLKIKNILSNQIIFNKISFQRFFKKERTKSIPTFP